MGVPPVPHGYAANMPWVVCLGCAMDLRSMSRLSATRLLCIVPCITPVCAVYALGRPWVGRGSAAGPLPWAQPGLPWVCYGRCRAMNIWWVRQKNCYWFASAICPASPPLRGAATCPPPQLQALRRKTSRGCKRATGLPERVDPFRIGIRQPRAACRHAMGVPWITCVCHGCAMGMPRVRYECSMGTPWVCHGCPLDVPWMRLMPRTYYVSASHPTAYVPKMCNA